MKQITYSSTAIKDLKKIGNANAKRIRAKIEQYAANPTSQANNVKALQGSDYLRLRVADWRVIFTEDMEVLSVVRVRHRKEAYR